MTVIPVLKPAVMLTMLAAMASERASAFTAFPHTPSRVQAPTATTTTALMGALNYRSSDQDDVDVGTSPEVSTVSDVDNPPGKSSAAAQATIHAPIDEVWAVYRSFCSLNDWFPAMGEWKCTGNDIGSTRSFNFLDNPTFFVTEKLVGLDDELHKMKFEMVDYKGGPFPPGTAVTTIVTLTPNGDTTDMDYRSWMKTEPANLADLIGPIQAKGYLKLMEALDKRVNPVLGTLDVTLKTANIAVGDDSSHVYANLLVTDANPVTVISKDWGTNPSFDAVPVQFDLLKPETTLYMSVMQTNNGTDTPIGYSTMNVQELTSGNPITKTVELKSENSPGATVTLDLELSMREGDKLPQSQAQKNLAALQALGKTADRLKHKISTLIKDVDGTDETVWEYTSQVGLPKSVKGLPRSELLSPYKVGLMITAISEYLYTQFNVIERLATTTNSFERYAAYFAPQGEEYVPTPFFLKDMVWSTDEEFLRQVFSGLNPMQVELLKNKERIPSKFNEIKAEDESDIDKLIAEGRLYMLDYSVMKDFDLHHYGCTLYAPIVLIYRTGGDQMNVLGIALEPLREDAPVYTPNSDTPNKYLLAKCHVACADNQVHQFTYHLGYGHLATEPLAIASHNVLEKNEHPLGSFLKPHFRGTIGINYLARQTLVAEEGAITDKTFAAGTKQGIKLVTDAFKTYDFLESGLPGDLKRRGFERTDDLENYRYRDDGWLIWDTLWTYAEDMVNALYDTDEDVIADKIVQEWAQESSDKERASIQGFPEAITSKFILTKILTTVVWQSSALHSALNYVQYPYTSTPINRAAAIYGAVPDGTSDITEKDILDAIPGGLGDENNRGLTLALFQGLLSWLLNSPEHPTLDEVSSRIPDVNNPEDLVAFRAKYPKVYHTFNENLAKVERIINSRNEGLDVPYDVLLPSKIAASINI